MTGPVGADELEICCRTRRFQSQPIPTSLRRLVKDGHSNRHPLKPSSLDGYQNERPKMPRVGTSGILGHHVASLLLPFAPTRSLRDERRVYEQWTPHGSGQGREAVAYP